MGSELLDCLDLTVDSVWYDTVDQPHISVKITNHCRTSLIIIIKLETMDGEKLSSISPIKLNVNDERRFELISDYPGTFLLTYMWKHHTGEKWNPGSSIKISI